MSDSLVLIDGNKFTEPAVFDAVDLVIQNLRKSNDITKATQIIAGLDSIEKVSGKAKAKLLFGAATWWQETQQEAKTGDDFFDHIESETETSATTAKRYIRVWGYVEDCTIPRDVAQRPMRDLVPIANALSQGYEIEKEHWVRLNRAANNKEILEIIKEVKGSDGRKSGMNIVMDRKGNLTAWKDNKPHAVGFLMINSTDEVTQKAIQRIIDNTPIQES